MNIKVVAISGWKRSGKDTVASLLINNYGFKKVSFADPLKEMVAHQYNIPLRYLHEQELKEKPLLQYPVVSKDNFSKAIHELLSNELKSGYWTPRALAILEGSIKRSVNSNYWTEQAINYIRRYNAYESVGNEIYQTKNNELFYVIPDLRYKNEAAQLKQAFGNDLLLVRINRFDTVDTTDPSERDLDDYNFDLVINNKSTLTQLEDNVKTMLENFL